jgi:hypothetical protein
VRLLARSIRSTRANSDGFHPKPGLRTYVLCRTGQVADLVVGVPRKGQQSKPLEAGFGCPPKTSGDTERFRKARTSCGSATHASRRNWWLREAWSRPKAIFKKNQGVWNSCFGLADALLYGHWIKAWFEQQRIGSEPLFSP